MGDRVADDAEVARRKESLIVAENNIRKAEDDLRALLFREQDSMWDVVLRPTSAIESDMDVSKLDWRTASAVAMVERPDLKSLQATAEIAEQGVVQAKSELRPRLDLVGSYNSAAIRNDSFANARDELHPRTHRKLSGKNNFYTICCWYFERTYILNISLSCSSSG